MTDQELIQLYEEMKQVFGDKLPNPEHHPLVFAYYLRLYLYTKTHGY